MTRWYEIFTCVYYFLHGGEVGCSVSAIAWRWALAVAKQFVDSEQK